MKTYSGDYAQEIAFPLSGIGTGGVSLSGIGQLIDWELDGRAAKCSTNEYTHFAVKAERNGQVIDARVLHGDRTLGLYGTQLAAHHHSWGYGQGPNRTTLAGLAHFPDVTFTGRFPFAELTYHCDAMPADIRLEAYNPFIPQDEDNSSLPAAFFDWTLTNTAGESTDYTLAFSVGNPFRIRDGGFCTYDNKNGISSLTLASRTRTPASEDYCQLRVATDCPDVSYQEYWFRSGWFDDVTTFWREFSAPGGLRNRHYDDDDPRGQMDIGDMCTLAAHVTLAPGEKKTLHFILSWYRPHFIKYWDGARPAWNHEYVRRFADVEAVSAYCFANRESLYRRSALFRDALESMTLPECVKEAAADNLCVLKSVTCLRLENGEFYAFEGTNGNGGSCEGTCDHVWGYQYALAFLFPSFARQILETDYTYNLRESGEMMFRTMLPLGSPMWSFRACVDGQMGSVMRFFREWKLSGDDEWLKKWWPCVRKTIEYAWSPENRDRWDPDKTGVITGRQHHTLDVEMFGPCSWLTGYYLGALKAGAVMADYLGETETAAEYRAILARGQAAVEKMLFNGAWYTQRIDVTDKSILAPFAQADPSVWWYWNDETGELKYQLGEGCEIDQLVGQWHAALIGLGDIFDPARRRTAAESLYKYNFKSMREVFNPCRIFAVNDECGMEMCVWPEGAYRPKIPVPYTEECMTGFEYAAAGLMIQEGLIKEGVEVIAAIRDRYDGKKRNPFSEIECGASYARSMASFSLPAIFSGYRFDMVSGEIGFRPVEPGKPHTTFWSVSGAWGTAEITPESVTLTVAEGSLALNAFIMPDADAAAAVTHVTADGQDVPFSADGDRVLFGRRIRINGTMVLSK